MRLGLRSSDSARKLQEWYANIAVFTRDDVSDRAHRLIDLLAHQQAVEANLPNLMLLQLYASQVLQDLQPVSADEPVDATVEALRPLFPLINWSGATPTKHVNDWLLLRTLGSGGQGTVYEVRKLNGPPETRAMKTLNSNSKAPDTERFAQEINLARTLAQTEHAGFASYYDSGTFDGSPYYVMEQLPSSMSRDEGFQPIGPDLRRLLHIFEPICAALSRAHEAGIVHRDLWPPNIRFRANGQPCVIDFGKAYAEGAPSLTSRDSTVVRGQFVPPEMNRRVRPEPAPSMDVYSVGKLLYYAIVGWVFEREEHRRPENNLVTMFGDTRLEYMNELLDRVLTTEPENRLDSIEKLREALATTVSRCLPAHHLVRPGMPCRACGQGKYEQATVNLLTPLFWQPIGEKQRRYGNNRANTVFVCDSCGLIELVDETLAKWLRGKWPVE